MDWNKINKAIENIEEQSVFYFASTEENLLRETALTVKNKLLLKEKQQDTTIIQGPIPNLGSVVEAAGTMSFFTGKRIVEIKEMAISSITDKDVEELCQLFSQIENAILLITAVYKDKKAASTKKAKALFAAAEKAGIAQELAKPTKSETIEYIQQKAQEQNTKISNKAADLLLTRAGDDRVLLATEVQKLAALSGYKEISEGLIQKYSVSNIEADVFALTRDIVDGRKALAFERMQDLLQQRNEPIAIAAALSGTFVDLYRAKMGTEKKFSPQMIFDDMGYKGNSYRMQKAKENATKYSVKQLEDSILCLAELDIALKSSALSSKEILLQTTLGELFVIAQK